MISLRQAKLTDAIPATLAAQPWAQALAYAEWRMRGLLHTTRNRPGSPP